MYTMLLERKLRNLLNHPDSFAYEEFEITLTEAQALDEEYTTCQEDGHDLHDGYRKASRVHLAYAHQPLSSFIGKIAIFATSPTSWRVWHGDGLKKHVYSTELEAFIAACACVDTTG